jgi:hypothetical protein
MTFGKASLTLLVVVLSLGMVACSPVQNVTNAVTAFSAIVNGGSIIATGLCQSGTIPANVCTVLLPALSDFAAVTPQIGAELESSDPLATQVSKSIALLAPLVAKDYPGLSPQAQAIITGVAQGAQYLITQLQSLLGQAASFDKIHPHAVQPAHLALGWNDRRAIADAVIQSEATIKLLQASMPVGGKK